MRTHLVLHDSPAAYADFQDGLQAYRALLGEPTLIAGLVRISALNPLLNAVGDGLNTHAWEDAELIRIDQNLAKLAVWQDFKLAFESEHAGANWMYELLIKTSPWKRGGLFSGGPGVWGGSEMTFLFLLPQRVYRDNQLQGNRYFDEMVSRVNADSTRYDPDLPAPSDPSQMTGWLDQYYFFLNRMSLGVFSAVIDRYVVLQTQLDETRVAIALERYRLARGGFPEMLAELVPEFLPAVPVDTYSKMPLIYRRKEGGTFLLYGVGKNRTDDGGVIDPKLGERKQLDDVWLYAPPPAL